MHFGLYLNPATPGPEHDGQRIQDVLRQCRLAEQLGFRAVWLTEQHFTNYNSYSDSMVLAGYLASHVPSLWLGLSVAVIGLHHPVRLAEQWSLLDNLTGGRFIAGVGTGNSPLELHGYGQYETERHDLFDETIDLVERLWAHQDGVLEYSTPHYRGSIDGRIVPRPVQQPHPMLARATGTLAYAEAWGARGQPMLIPSRGIEHTREAVAAYRRGLERAPVSEARRALAWSWTTLHHVVQVAETDEQAWTDYEPYLEQHLVNYALANRGEHSTLAELDPVWVDNYRRNQLVVGSPETVTARLRPYQDLGIQHVMIWVNQGGIPAWQVERTLTLFAERVMPLLA